MNVYLHHSFTAQSRDGKGHDIGVLCAVKSYRPKIKDEVQLTHRATIGWAEVRTLQQKTLCSRDLATGYGHFCALKVISKRLNGCTGVGLFYQK